MKKVSLKPVFVKTKNVRNFEAMIDGLLLNAGEGCLGMIWGRAGRGKTRTTQWYVANGMDVYIRAQAIWRTSETEFLRTLCRELGVVKPPKQKVPAYNAALEALMANTRIIFIDEFEKLPRHFLEIVRDLSDMSGCAFVLVGEEALVSFMNQDRRAWSRVFQVLEFKPIEVADIIMFASESAGLKLSIDVANELHHESGGDFRLVKRYLLSLYQMHQADPDKDITVDMARMIIKSAFKGR